MPENNEVFMNKTGEISAAKKNEKIVTEFQKTLSNTTFLLLELKSLPDLSQAQRKEIDFTAEKLQKIIIEIPNMSCSPNLFNPIFKLIKKLFVIWHNIPD
jgi:hypothetical protein